MSRIESPWPGALEKEPPGAPYMHKRAATMASAFSGQYALEANTMLSRCTPPASLQVS